MAELFERIASLSEKKRALLELRRQNASRMSRLYPLSFAQQRLWFLDQMEPGGSSYNVPCSLRLQGELDENALRRSVTEIVRRHEVLRTVFPAEQGKPVQQIAPPSSVPVAVVDLQDVEEKMSVARRISTKEAIRPFDLGLGPLLRVVLVRLAENDHLLLVTMHHIVSDGWSMGILVREFTHLYEAYRNGHDSNLADLKIQYKDYAAWQRAWLQGPVLDEQLEYWRAQLEGVAPLKLPTDYPRSAAVSGSAATVRFTLSQDATQSLTCLSQTHGATLFMALVAGFKITLGRYCGQDDVAVGTGIANRTRLETEDLIGFFINTLVLRSRLKGEARFLDLLEDVRETVMGAYAHQDLPFDRLVEELVPERAPGQTPFFQALLALQNLPEAPLELPGLKLSTWESGVGIARFDLSMMMTPKEGGLSCVLEYVPELFTPERIERLAGYLVRVLEQAAADPKIRLRDISLLTEAERSQILWQWNTTSHACPEITVHELFAQRAAAQWPDSVAIVSGQEAVTYRELNRRANQLAHFLISLGVGLEVRVALCVERGTDLLVGLLGILKAGGAYVPLDASYPAERLAWMLEDSQAPVILTQERLRDRIPSNWVQVVSLDAEWELVGAQPTHDYELSVPQDGLAYVIYTSGSSGKPKGTLVTHRGLANYVSWAATTYECGKGEPSPVHTSLSFDLTVTSIFPPLISGGTVNLLRETPTLEDLVSQFANNEQLGLVKLTPSHLRILTQLLRKGSAGKARCMVIGGEALNYEDVTFWREHAPQTRLINEYGPTETVVGCSIHELNGELKWRGPVSIGRPIVNTRLYVLNDEEDLSVTGTTGQLYIAGLGLARGYLNRPELTAAKFRPDPFSDEPGSRMYSSGDAARWRHDGTLEFLGRCDEQLKVQGYRIEPGEIEAVLGQHPGVRQSAVIPGEATGDESGQLIAYVVPQPWAMPPRHGSFLLPTGMALAHQNKHETEFLYDEIFVRRMYLQHGIDLPEDACVFDVGANIGMFTLFAAEYCRNGQIFAFEPIGPVFEDLSANVVQCASTVHLFPYGISNSEKIAEFTWYPGYSMMSGLSSYADPKEELGIIRQFLMNEAQEGSEEARNFLARADEVLKDRFRPKTIDVRLRRLSDVIHEYNVERIDLLKIDVEHSEIDVLQGIDDEHWDRIGQIVVEVHDRIGTTEVGRVMLVRSLLESHGFDVVIEEDPTLRGTHICNLYARKKGRAPARDFMEVSRSHRRSPLVEQELREFVKARLPMYMCPAHYVFLERMPLTSNGKLNKTALPAPKHEQRSERIALPRTPVEEILAGIWASVLKSDRPGIHDSFFELGGHSLLATQVASRVESIFGIELPLRVLFESKTIAAIAEFIESRLRLASQSPAPAMVQTSRKGSLPLSFAQQRLWFLDQMEPGSHAYNLAFALRLTGLLDVAALRKAIGEIVRRHEVLRTSFPVVDDEPVQQIAPWFPPPVPLIDCSQAEDRYGMVQSLARASSERPFDLNHGPLLRTMLLRLAARDHVLLINLHHIVSDGWSIGVLMHEFTTIYGAVSRGLPVPLEDIPIQYADFSAWQRQWMNGEVLEDRLAYWRGQLAGISALELPTDYPRSAVKSYRSAVVTFEVAAELTERLEALAHQEGVTLFITVLAAFQMLLSQITGQRDVAVGAAVANRNRVETERLVGFFVNTLVLRTKVEGSAKLREFLADVRRTTLDAFRCQDVPFEKIVEDIAPERALNRSPLFQAMLVFQNLPKIDTACHGLELSLLHDEYPSVRSDVDLYMMAASERMTGHLVYSPQMFDHSTIQQWARDFLSLLTAMSGKPDLPVAELIYHERPELPAMAEERALTPLSYHQERLWFIDRFETGVVYESSPVYHNIPLLLRFDAPIDSEILRGAIHELAERHEILRTVIVQQSGQAFQRTAQPTRVPLEIRDMSHDREHVGGRVSDEQLIQIALEAARVPFILEGNLLLRVTLFCWPQSLCLLVITAHHIVADRISMRCIAEELAEIYSARVERRLPALPAIGVRFRQFAEWQRGVDGKAWEPYVRFWKNQLAAELVNLELPAICHRHAVHVYEGKRLRFLLPPGLGQAVRRLAEQEKTEVAHVLFACFYALLHLYSGQETFLVGTIDPGRTMPGSERAIGPFFNLIVRGGKLRSSTFAEFLAAITRSAGRIENYRDLPFDFLVQKLKIPNDMSRTALFDVLFHYDEPGPGVLRYGPVQGRVLESNVGYGKYDLNLLIQNTPVGFVANLVYNNKLYAGSMIRGMAGHLRTLIEAVTADPSVRIAELALLNASEQAQQMELWNATAAAFPNKTIQQIFEEQVLEHPDRVALRWNEDRVSFAELNLRANRLAHLLIAQGVTADTLVAICLDRSPEIVIAILGVLKSGGGYLPLDPLYPEDRLRFMMSDAAVRHLVTKEGLAGRASEQLPFVTLLDKDQRQVEAQSTANPLARGGPDTLAYCIYTSGSTGKPNGVLIEHRQVVRLIRNDKPGFSFSNDDVWTLFHSCSFDFSVWEICGALLYGATVVVVPGETTRDPQSFVDLLERESVTVLNQTPASFYGVAAALERSNRCLALRYVIFGGEALQPSYLKSWKVEYPQVALINMYGITETTVHVTFRKITEEDIQQGVSNIGNPIPITTTYILGPGRSLIPEGVRGEIYVGGEGLARGYLNRPDLTAERFVPDPLAHKTGSRLYRTGDTARYLPDGSMEFLGRIDHQVKLRGYRIELGEIEELLLAQPRVAAAVVQLREDPGKQKQLVAYLVGKSKKETMDVEAIRQSLRHKLPAYMVPAFFVELPAMPLTFNGKVDRRALPPPEPEAGADECHTGPRTPVEEILSVVWMKVLGLKRVGIHENFFELGGHSLLATQVMSRMKNALGIELPLRVLFERPTIAAISEQIQNFQQGRQKKGAPPITRAERTESAPLSFAQERLWFVDQWSPRDPAYNIPVAISLEGKLDVDAMRRSLNHIVRRHEIIRTMFPSQAGRAVQRVAEAYDLSLELIDLQGSKALAERTARELAMRPFNLSTGPLLRAALIKLAEEEHVLLVTMHHIVSDEWSIAVMRREVALCYEAYCQGKEPKLEDLKIQYRDYAMWQREWLRGEVLEKEMEYWRRQLVDIPSIELPADYTRPATSTRRGAQEAFHLPAEVTAKLHELSREHSVTLFMVLLTGFQITIGRWVGKQDMAIGTQIANRNHLEIEGLIGLFTNTLVLRTDLSGNPSFRESLNRIRRTVLEAHEHQDLPFEKLVATQVSARDTGESPFFRVKLIVHNVEPSPPALPGLAVRPFNIEGSVYRPELLLNLVEAGGSLQGRIYYDPDLFSPVTMRGLLHFFRAILSVVAGEEQILDAAGDKLLRAVERKALSLVQQSRATSPLAAARQRRAHSIP